MIVQQKKDLLLTIIAIPNPKALLAWISKNNKIVESSYNKGST